MKTPIVCLGLALAGLAAPQARAGAAPSGEGVLFAFDDHALPFQEGLKLQLIGFQVAKRTTANTVIRPGAPGTPDSKGCYYYGSVAEVNGELYLWYTGAGDREGSTAVLDSPLRLCLAKSTDGIHWTKPDLGLVDYAGNRRNNLVSLRGRAFATSECVLLYEPEDPDPQRRFKMVFESDRYRAKMAVATSPDGVRWSEPADNPRLPWGEPSGLTKWRGAYDVSAHARGHWTPVTPWSRVLDTFVSYDFENWTQAPALGFRRDPLPPRPISLTGQDDGEQVHLGASLWNRGNVIVGFYGMWHGVPSNDRRFVGIDLGLVVSHDALHYWEPIPDFRIVAARELTYYLPFERAPSLAQGQGFANVGDKSLFWYSAWGMPIDGVRVATWERDRLGFLQPFESSREMPPYLLSAPVPTGRQAGGGRDQRFRASAT